MEKSIEDSGKLIATNNDEIIKERIKLIENSLERFMPDFNEIHEESETMKKSTEEVLGDIKCLTNDSTKLKERVVKLEVSFKQNSEVCIKREEFSDCKFIKGVLKKIHSSLYIHFLPIFICIYQSIMLWLICTKVWFQTCEINLEKI